MSVTEIAERCKSTRTAISDLLHGHSIEPRYKLALAIIAEHKLAKRRKTA